MNIYQKLIEVRKEVPYIQKADKGAQYNYTGSSRVLSSVRAKLDDLGLLLIPEVLSTNVMSDTQEKNDGKRTTTYFTELHMQFTWINAENPEEKITCPWYGQGVDIAGEKGVGKALTYAEKYFMLKFFNIATDKDDPDAFQHEQDKKQPKEPAATAEQMSTIAKTKKQLGLNSAQLKGITSKLGINPDAMTASQADQLIHELSASQAEGATH